MTPHCRNIIVSPQLLRKIDLRIALVNCNSSSDACVQGEKRKAWSKWPIRRTERRLVVVLILFVFDNESRLELI
jgi:hypothetical protein